MYYTHNLEIYAGRHPDGPWKVPNDAYNVIVNQILRHTLNTGRNVTCDSYFTSIPLANDLYHNKQTTLVGTLKKNKREIPPIFTNTKTRPITSSVFADGVGVNKCLLTSYVPKKNKNVLVIYFV